MFLNVVVRLMQCCDCASIRAVIEPDVRRTDGRASSLLGCARSSSMQEAVVTLTVAFLGPPWRLPAGEWCCSYLRTVTMWPECVAA